MGTNERRQRERTPRREAILDAALAVFAEKGLRRTTMDEIAARVQADSAEDPATKAGTIRGRVADVVVRPGRANGRGRDRVA